MDVESIVQVELTSRSEVKFYHYLGDFFNILKAFIGTNYQALPFAFKNSGLVFGILGVLGIAALTDHCCQLMVRCKYYVIDKVVAEETEKGDLSPGEIQKIRTTLGRTLTYGDIGMKVFGRWCYHLIQIAVWFTQFTTAIAYFIFIGNTVYELFPMIPLEINVHNSSVPAGPHVMTGDPGLGVPMLNLPYVGHKTGELTNGTFESPSDFILGLSKRDLSGIYVENQPLDMDMYSWMESSNANSVYSSKKNIYTMSNVSTADPIQNAITVTFEPIITNVTTVPTVNPNITTTAASNSTDNTTIPPRTTKSGPLPTAPPTAAISWIPSAPDLKWVVLFPLPFFLLTALIKKVRLIAPFSFIATVFLGIGAMSVFVYLMHGFTIFSGGFHLVQFATLPLFIGQLISAYEGIGCIIPIESSMEGNRWVFPYFLHAAVYIVFVILCCFGTVGYLRYGTDVEQLIVLNLAQHTPLSIFIDVTLILSVMFTYPLQTFPVLEIAEAYIFTSGACCKKQKKSRLEYDEIENSSGETDYVGSDRIQTHGLIESASLEASITEASVNVQKSGIPTWKKNILRLVMTLIIAGSAILLRNAYAYLAAFTGAVGCSLLAYIIPCAVHMKVKWPTLSDKNKVKDILIIIFSVVVSIMTIVAIVQQFIQHKAI